MRFLFFSPGYHPDIPGGAWRVTEELSRRLAGRGHDMDVITNHPGASFEAFEIRAKVRIHRVGPARPSRWHPAFFERNRQARMIGRELLDRAGGTVLVGTHHAYFEPAVRGLGVPWIAVFQGPWAREYAWSASARNRPAVWRLWDGWLERQFEQRERRLLAGAKRIVVISRHFESKLSEWHPVALPPVQRLHGSVDLERFDVPSHREALRAEWGLRPADRMVLAVRRLDPRMGLEVLISAFALVVPSVPQAQLWIAGTGPYDAALRRCAKGAGVVERVRFLVRVEEEVLPKLYGAADVTVMPSLDLEGFGLATIESMACGTPVLGSRSAATPEILEPLSPELLFEPGSVQDLAMKLERSLTHPEGLPSAARCREHVSERFSWEPWIRAWKQWAEERET